LLAQLESVDVGRQVVHVAEQGWSHDRPAAPAGRCPTGHGCR